MTRLPDAIADSSSLIVLARLDGLSLLTRGFEAVAIVPEVEHESVVQGLARGYADARRIESAIRSGEIVVIEPTSAEKRLASQFLRQAPALSQIDCLTLACAKMRSVTLVMEEQRGRNVAVASGIDYIVIQALPLHGFIEHWLSFEECEEWLVEIGQAMRTDRAVLNVLRAAAQEIHRLREANQDE
jgi:predicted nucleic acid-binding protein